MNPLVSVIIPTYQRPALVTRAVQSALAQTLPEIEVIVVMDSPDIATRVALESIRDARVTVVELPEPRGAPAARNQGIARATADWIAILDDDDEWLPRKLEIQLATAKSSCYSHPIVSCRVIARTGVADFIWPRRVPSAAEPLSEYLFCQHGLRAGEALIIPTTIFTSIHLARQVPFSPKVKRHDDADWLLHATQVKGTGIEFAKSREPLAIWHLENHPRLSTTRAWQLSLGWAQTHQHLLTPRAYGSFLMTWANSSAALARDWKGFFQLAWEAHRRGKPSFVDWMAALSVWLLPPDARYRITALAQKFFARFKRQ